MVDLRAKKSLKKFVYTLLVWAWCSRRSRARRCGGRRAMRARRLVSRAIDAHAELRGSTRGGTRRAKKLPPLLRLLVC